MLNLSCFFSIYFYFIYLPPIYLGGIFYSIVLLLYREMNSHNLMKMRI